MQRGYKTTEHIQERGRLQVRLQQPSVDGPAKTVPSPAWHVRECPVLGSFFLLEWQTTRKGYTLVWFSVSKHSDAI